MISYKPNETHFVPNPNIQYLTTLAWPLHCGKGILLKGIQEKGTPLYY